MNQTQVNFDALRRETRSLTRRSNLESIGKIVAKIIIYRIPNRGRHKIIQEVISEILRSDRFSTYWNTAKGLSFVEKYLDDYPVVIDHIQYKFTEEHLTPLNTLELLLHAFGEAKSPEVLYYAVDSMIFLEQNGTLGGSAKHELTWEIAERFRDEMRIGELGISYCIRNYPELRKICLADL